MPQSQIPIFEYKTLSVGAYQMTSEGVISFLAFDTARLETDMNKLASEGFSVAGVTAQLIIMGRIVGAAVVQLEEPLVAGVQLGPHPVRPARA